MKDEIIKEINFFKKLMKEYDKSIPIEEVQILIKKLLKFCKKDG